MSLYNKKLTSKEPIYSFHSFIFPFEWSYNGRGERPLEEQTELKTLEQKMQSENDWERRQSWDKPSTIVQYNESAYFYDFVRHVLYDTGKNASIQRHYYNTKAAHDCEYIIELYDGSKYILEIDDIVLSFYDTGVGVLAFHLINKRIDQSSPNDILKINALGRRVYPPFFQSDTNLIGQQAFFEYNQWEDALDATQQTNDIAKAIHIKHKGEAWVGDDFSEWVSNQDLDRTPGIIKGLLPIPIVSDLKIKPALDDRMFTLCWYGNKALVADLQGKQPDENYKQHEWWYQYVFVDGGYKTCQSDRRTKHLLEGATNDRWANDGTFYGVSRYSFMALTENISDNSFGAVICSHIQTIYYKIALLGLVQRASLLRFSEEITAISELPKDDKHTTKRISSLYKEYIRFINRVYFREVTAQEQGIELYDSLQEQMRLPSQVKELDQEMQELHQYVLILEEEQRNEKLDLLTYFAALFVVPSFIGTYLGIGDFQMKEHWMSVSVLCLISALIALGIIKTKSFTRWFLLFITVMLMIFILFIYPKTGF